MHKLSTSTIKARRKWWKHVTAIQDEFSRQFIHEHKRISEVVEATKRRGPAGNSAKLKVVGQENVIGYVFWCELRASAKLITEAPTA